MRALARVVAGRRSKWAVIAAWGALAAAALPFAADLPDRLVNAAATPDQLGGDAQGREIQRNLRERFASGEPRLALVVHRRAGGLTGADRAAVLEAAREARAIPDTLPPVPPFGPGSQPGLLARDGSVAVTAVALTTPEAAERIEAVERLREIAGEGGGGLRVHVTGPAAIEVDLTEAIQETDLPLLATTGVLVLVLLLAIYRSPLVALLPLTVVGIAAVVALAAIDLYSHASGRLIDRPAISLLIVLMFGAGTDYCLLMVARHTRNLRTTADAHDAARAAVPHAGPLIVASGATVAGALLTLAAAELEANSVLGPVLAIGVVAVVAAGITLLPAALTVAGRRGFWPSTRQVRYEPPAAEPALLPGLGPLPPALRAASQRAGVVSATRGAWDRFGERILRRPWLALAGTLAVLGAGALGLLTYEQDVDLVAQFRGGNDATEGFDALRTAFPAGALYPNTVMVERDGGPLRPADIELARTRMAALDGVALVSDVSNTSRDGRLATFSVTFADDPFGAAALDRARRMRAELASLAPGLSGLVGDGSAGRVDYVEGSDADRARVIPLVLGVILVTLILLLRSVVAPLYLLGTVLLSFLATVGVSLLCFDLLFGLDSVEPSYLILAFVFLVALGVDYNIFLMGEVRGEALRHGTRAGVLRALASTGPVITSAGLILAGTFAVLAILPLNVLLQLGFTVAVGVLIDTFLVRTILVPAIASLAGDASWWPARVGRPAPVVSGVHRLAGPLPELEAPGGSERP